jgi:FdhD protein
MTAKTVETNYTSVTPGKRQATSGPIVCELPLTINLNGRELVTTLCSPTELEYLVAGILFSEGIIQNREDIAAITVDFAAGTAEARVAGCTDGNRTAFRPLVASGGGKGASSYAAGRPGFPGVQSETRVSAAGVQDLVSNFLHYSDAYQVTHGVHSAALCDAQKILVFSDDIGRHNALDKVFGRCLLEGISVAGGIIITSGRISSEILLKVAKRGIPVLISKAPPTDMGIKLATELGITLVVARRDEIAVYSHDWRVM